MKQVAMGAATIIPDLLRTGVFNPLRDLKANPMTPTQLLAIHTILTVLFGGLCAWAISVTPWAPLAAIPFMTGMAALVLLGAHLYYFGRRYVGAPDQVI
nr:hypothetical protein [Brevundimonas diminuta]